MSAQPPRDELVGAALRELPVPEHGPAFWAELQVALAEASAAESDPSSRSPWGSAGE